MGSTSVLNRIPLAQPESSEKMAVGTGPQAEPTAIIALPSGHRVAYEEFGDPHGRPMFYFHDRGSSRLECAFLHCSAKDHGIRLISPDRPGIGCSSYYSNATAGAIATDMIQLADWLKIEQFGVVSQGAGGIFALALAHACPDRVFRFISLAGVPGSVFRESAAGSDLIQFLGLGVPSLVKVLVRCRFALFREEPGTTLKRALKYLSHADRNILNESRVRRTMALDQKEMMRQGSRGLAQDLSNCFRKLDFSLADVTVPTTIWQGRSDSLSQRADCEFMASHMPTASYHRVSNAGHFFFIHSMDSVFSRLRGEAQTSAALVA